MNKRINDLLGTARRLESAIAARVEGTARRVTGSSPKAPLEIAHAIVEVAEQQIQPVGRGQRAYPFNRIRVAVLAASPLAKAHLELACEGPPSIQQRIADRLSAAGCSVSDLSVTVSFVKKGRPEWSQPEFHIAYERDVSPVASEPAIGLRLELTVIHGTTGQASYAFTTWPVALGRGVDVRDSRQRLIRTNHVAFTEGGGEINHSVSRCHARIEHDPAFCAYRVFDDGSAQGTSVVRKGRGLPVPRGTRGMILQSGDELVLGQARLRVRVCGTCPPTKEFSRSATRFSKTL
jgi:hypothetical protein